MEKPTLNVSLMTIVSLILLFEGPVRVAIEQICLHLMILSAKVRKLSETSKEMLDFLVNRASPTLHYVVHNTTIDYKISKK